MTTLYAEMELQYVYVLVAVVFLTGVSVLSLVSFEKEPETLETYLPTRATIGQVHIALGPLPHSINIIWVLKSQADLCYVSFGSYSLYSPDCSLVHYVNDAGLEYFSYVYNLTAYNLEPEKTYAYQVVCVLESFPQTSERYFFQGPKRPNSPITFISLADWSTGPRSDPFDNYTNHPKPNIYPFLYRDIRENRYDAIIHAGDYAYDLSSFGGRMGDDFLNSIEPIASRVPYMTTTGNHESYTNFTHYRGVFKTPGSELYYSFNLGYAHFIMLDSEAYVGRFHTEEQLKGHQRWLESDLEKNTQPWVIMASHRPIYCNPNPKCKVCTNSCTKYCLVMAEYIEELSVKYNVALFISADVHLYERSKPIYRNKTAQEGTSVFINPPAPIYIVNGVAGNFDRDDSMTLVAETLQPWTVHISDSLGYGRITVFNQSHLHWEQVAIGKNQNDDMEWLLRQKPRIIDDFWIIKREE